MSSLNDKLEYLKQTKSLMKSLLNLHGASIGDTTPFRDYVGIMEGIIDSFTWMRASEVTPINKGKVNLKFDRAGLEFYTAEDLSVEGAYATIITLTLEDSRTYALVLKKDSINDKYELYWKINDGSSEDSVFVWAGTMVMEGDSYTITKKDNNTYLIVLNQNTTLNYSSEDKAVVSTEGDADIVYEIFIEKAGGESMNIDSIYPVGSIYMSIVSTNPSDLFGGTWEQLGGRFLMGAGAPGTNTRNDFGIVTADQATGWSWAPGEKGGEYQHTLGVNEMPSHQHTGTTTTNGNHLHNGIYDSSGELLQAWRYSKGDTSSGLGKYREDPYTQPYTGAAGDHAHTFTTNATGESGAHNNIPPYLVVYMWKRTA